MRLLSAISTLMILARALSADVSADCNLPKSGRVALERADVVFRGQLRQVQEVRRAGWWGRILTFEVSRVWKGNVGPVFMLHYSPDSAEDVPFEQGIEYLVFASKNPPPVDQRFGATGPTYDADGCGGTVSMVGASRYLLDLGQGRAASEKSRPPDPRTLQ